MARFFRWDAHAARQGSNLTLYTDVGPVDLLAHVPGLRRYPVGRAAATSVLLYGHPLAIPDLPWLIRAQQAAGRPKHLAVLPELETFLRLRAVDSRREGPDGSSPRGHNALDG